MANIRRDMLVEAIASKVNSSRKEIDLIIDKIIDKITEEIKNGNKVTLTGFGTFRASKRAAREGINPQTKERIQIPAMSVPKFTAGKALKEAVK